MRSGSLAQFLLSLFTSRQRAAEIEGDLLEEGAARGRSWIALQIVSVTFALFWECSKEAPLRVAALSVLATTLSLVASILVDQLLLGPNALLPLPTTLGLVMVAVLVFLIGWALGYFGSGFGIRASVWSVFLLTLLLIIQEAHFVYSHYVIIIDLSRLGEALGTVVRSIGYLLLSIAALPAPLMTGGILGHRQRSRA